MALGAADFITYNKSIPGAYVQFVSLSASSAVSASRGVAAVALETDWGAAQTIVRMTADEYAGRRREFFASTDTQSLIPLDEIFKNANEVLFYRLNGGGSAAENELATAVCPGVGGDHLAVKTEKDADNEGGYVVTTLLDLSPVDVQYVDSAAELKDNLYVKFKADASLTEEKVYPLSGGSNSETTVADHEKFLDLLESESFDSLALASDDSELKELYRNRTRIMRGGGQHFQCVLYNCAADDEGVINVGTAVKGAVPGAAVYWVAGLNAGTHVGSTAFNRVYDGVYELSADYTRRQLTELLQSGAFVFRRVGKEFRVTADINSLTTFTAEKGAVFADNETVRTVDRIADDTAALFVEKYMGVVPNSQSGRVSLKSDIVSMLKTLRDCGAIEDVSSDSVTVEAGPDRHSVVIHTAITIVGTMTTLYLTSVVA